MGVIAESLADDLMRPEEQQQQASPRLACLEQACDDVSIAAQPSVTKLADALRWRREQGSSKRSRTKEEEWRRFQNQSSCRCCQNEAGCGTRQDTSPCIRGA